MSKKVIFLLVSMVLGSTIMLSAQNSSPIMKFDSKQHDFGTFKEEKGKVAYSFEFVNSGAQPIIIRQVRTSCGCTSPEWTKQPVAPGKKGHIKVTFDPKNRPGPFNKSITITANTQPSLTILRIKGNVIEREKTVADLYPTRYQGFRMKFNHIAFTKTKNTEVKNQELEVYNDSETPIEIGFRRMPSHLQIRMVPEKLQPKQKGKIIATYDGTKKNDWGYIYDYLDLLVNGDYKPGQRLVVSANITEDFSRLSEKDRENAPKIQFNEKVFDFGQLTQGEKSEHVFKMKNSGKSDLIIRKTHASCGCTAITSGASIIKPGQETEIKVVFNSRGKRGRQNKYITVITNDPFSSSVKLRVSGNVVMPKI